MDGWMERMIDINSQLKLKLLLLIVVLFLILIAAVGISFLPFFVSRKEGREERNHRRYVGPC
jgi:flagellar basal body-associated protein FliL